MDHSAWCFGSKMAWRGILVSLDWLGGPDGERAVRADQWLRAGWQNGSANIGS